MFLKMTEGEYYFFLEYMATCVQGLFTSYHVKAFLNFFVRREERKAHKGTIIFVYPSSLPLKKVTSSDFGYGFDVKWIKGI